MAEKVGVFDRLFISAGASDATYTEFEFMEGSNIGLQEAFLDSGGLVGSRSRPKERVRRGARQVQGNLSFQPSPDELDILLVWAFGTAKSGNTIAIAETVPGRWLKTYRDGIYHLYDGCKVDSLTLSSSENSALSAQLSVIGVDEVESVAPTSPAAIDLDAGPYVHSDCAMTLAATAYSFRQLQISINNFLEVRHNNSLTPTSIHATNRAVGVQAGFPYGEAGALYGSDIAGIAVVATYTNGGRSLTLTMPAVQTPRTPLPYGQRGAATLTWSGTARKSGSTAEITATNDVTA
jgi:hypothetical protein